MGDPSRDSASWQALSVTTVLAACRDPLLAAARGVEEEVEVVGSKELEEPEFFTTKRSVEFGISLGSFVQESSADFDSAAVTQVGTEECSEPSVTRGWDSIVSIGSASDEGSKSADVARGAGEQDR